MTIFNIKNEIEEKISQCNNQVAKAASDYFLTLDNLKKIMSEDDKYLLEEHLLEVENIYQKILKLYRPAIRKYVERHIRTILFKNDDIIGDSQCKN